MIFLTIVALLYFLPTIVASNRGHEVTPILLLNFFFGWTGIGWIALLLWALLAWPRYAVYAPPVAYYSPVYPPPPVSYPPPTWYR